MLSHPAAPEPRPLGLADRRLRVLVVDDHADIRLLVRRILQREGGAIEIDEAENGVEALAKIEMRRPNLVVLDLMMPNMDGVEVCRRVRSNLQTALVPILMLTARSDAESRSEAFLAGTDDYLAKPFDGEELRTRVRWLLAGALRRVTS